MKSVVETRLLSKTQSAHYSRIRRVVISLLVLFIACALWRSHSSSTHHHQPHEDATQPQLMITHDGHRLNMVDSSSSTPSPSSTAGVAPRRSHHHPVGVDPLSASASMCHVKPRTFEPLRSFHFWGKWMNVSSPCPTAGLNNQLVMLLGLLHCSLTAAPSSAATSGSGSVFRFKDITCSPTGGKEGRKQFRVGSDDYEYQWFRWTELFDVRPYPTQPVRELCFADSYTWSEHPWMKRCPTFVDHIYGTREFWHMRSMLPLHRWFDQFSIQMAIDYANSTSTRSSHQPHDSAAPDTVTTWRPSFLAIHVRRGDYENFCRQTAKSSGVRKFRTAPFVWSQRASETQLRDAGLSTRPKPLFSKFMNSCFPSTAMIVSSIEKICLEGSFAFLYVATNSISFLRELRSALSVSRVSCAKNLEVVTFRDYMQRQVALGLAARHHSYWGRRQPHASPPWSAYSSVEEPSSEPQRRNDDSNDVIAPAVITETEAAMLDVNMISFASAVVLNKYSTFSQSAIDFRMVRDGSLQNMSIYWW